MSESAAKVGKRLGKMIGSWSLIAVGWIWGVHGWLWAIAAWGILIAAGFCLYGVIAYFGDKGRERREPRVDRFVHIPPSQRSAG